MIPGKSVCECMCVLGVCVCAGGKNLELMNNEGVVVKIWCFKDVLVPNRLL